MWLIRFEVWLLSPAAADANGQGSHAGSAPTPSTKMRPNSPGHAIVRQFPEAIQASGPSHIVPVTTGCARVTYCQWT